MGLIMKLSLLVATLCVLQVYGYDEDEYKRALKAFHLLQREQERREEQRRGLADCKALHEGCYGMPKCCGELQCYWADGYKPFVAGKCVHCVELNFKCQNDDQCCEGTVCSKGGLLYVDGHCKAPIVSGECIDDSQCVGTCSRKWYQGSGSCISS